MEGSYKAAKGLIRIKARVQSGRLCEVQISGDFFMHPEDVLWDLERDLVGTAVSGDKILSKIKAFYEREDVLSPGLSPEDLAEAITRTISGTALP